MRQLVPRWVPVSLLAAVADTGRGAAHQRGDRRADAGREAVDGCMNLSEDSSCLAGCFYYYYLLGGSAQACAP